MDELTTRLLRRVIRLHGRALAITLLAVFLLGWIASSYLFALGVVLFPTGLLLLRAAEDRSHPAMQALLSAVNGRRAWSVAYLFAGTTATFLACFSFLLPQGVRLALGVSLIALVYGWITASLGIGVLLWSERPREAVVLAGIGIVMLTLSAPPLAFTGSGASFHPLLALSYALHRAMGNGISSIAPGVLPGWQGMILPILLSLFVWRWGLRISDRMEWLAKEA